MNDRPLVITLPSGEQFALVESHTIARWDRETAFAQIHAALRDDGQMDRVRAAAQGLGIAVGDDDDPAQVAERIATAIADGAVRVVIRDDPPSLRPVLWPGKSSSEEPVRLVELVRPEPTTSWVSFAVIDSMGRPIADAAVVTLRVDGTRERVVLDGNGACVVRGLTRSDRIRVELPAAGGFRWPTDAAAVAVASPGDVEIRSTAGQVVQLGVTERHHRISLVRESPGFSG